VRKKHIKHEDVSKSFAAIRIIGAGKCTHLPGKKHQKAPKSTKKRQKQKGERRTQSKKLNTLRK
jgi:hypothetical protein